MEIDFYYDFGSPNAYLAWKSLPEIAARHGVDLRHRPVLLGGVFKATGNRSPIEAFAGIPPKLDYFRAEMMRFVERHAVPFTMNPHFPVNTLALMRGAVWASGTDWEAAYTKAAFEAMWLDGVKMDDPGEMSRVFAAVGLPVAEIAEAIATPEVKSGLIAATEAAVARGVFGAPTMFVQDEMFFGKDSLDDLDWRLGQSASG